MVISIAIAAKISHIFMGAVRLETGLKFLSIWLLAVEDVGSGSEAG